MVINMKYYLIGYPLNYSHSPFIHKSFNSEIDYSIKVLEEKDLDEFFQKKEFSGLNVTIPYKEKVIKYLDEISPIAKEIGAVNTIVNKNGLLYGYNTDYEGVKKTFELNNVKIKDKVVMILGSGGTYKTISYLCKSLKAKKIIGVSRNKKEGFITYEEIDEYKDVDILINTTPVGTYPNVFDQIVSLSSFKKLECILDMIYNPLQTSLILEGKKKKVKTINGLQVLVYQAGLAQELFFKRKIEDNLYQKVYKETLLECQSITLVGLPGSGKTTIGKALSSVLGYEFIDTDREIEKLEGITISEIFNSKGEKYFREKEEEYIKKIFLNKKVVISTGGGMIENPTIMRYLKCNTKIVWLDRNMSKELFNGTRPKLKTKKDYLYLKKRRESLYKSNSDFKIKNEGPTEKTIERIKERL